MLSLLSLLINSSQYLFTVNASFPAALFQYKVAFKMANDISCAELTDSVFFFFCRLFEFFSFIFSLSGYVFYANIMLRLMIQSHCLAGRLIYLSLMCSHGKVSTKTGRASDKD